MSLLASILLGVQPKRQELTTKEKHRIAEEAQIRATDRRYLECLSREKWRTYGYVQKKLGVCRAAVIKRIRRFEAMGVVKKTYVKEKNYQRTYFLMTKEGKKYYASLQENTK